MQWQTAVPNASEITSSAAHLLDALELVRPLGDSDSRLSPSMLGRWIMESGEDGTIADDTVIWLHHLLLPRREALGAAARVPAASRKYSPPTGRLAIRNGTNGLFESPPTQPILPIAPRRA